MKTLTPREQQTHDLLVLGRTRREIALQLVISPETVKCHVAAVYEKTASYGQLDLVLNHYNLPKGEDVLTTALSG